MPTRAKRAPRARTQRSASTSARTISRGDLKRAIDRNDDREPRSIPIADPSTANDLNAGRGTEGPRDETGSVRERTATTTRRGTGSARTRRDDVPRPSPDGSTSTNASSSAYETEGLRERTSRSDVEGDVAG